MTKQQIAILAALGLAVLCVLCFGGYIVVSEESAYKASQVAIEPATESLASTPVPTDTLPPTEYYSEEEILQVRKQFTVEVLDFNAKDGFGVEFPLSDYARLRITNNSSMTLPCLTVLTKRFDAQGEMIGSSRAPSIPTSNVKPGESFEYDYYPKGHLPSVVNITVEIEHVINPNSREFFPELNQKIPKPVTR